MVNAGTESIRSSSSMSSHSEVKLESAELSAFLEFLEEAPGRISIAEVPGPLVTRELIRLVRERSRLPVREVPVAPPRQLVEAVSRDVETDAIALVTGLDSESAFPSEDAAAQFWRDLNLQRESLAAGLVRCCLFVNPENHDRMAAHADDLRSWAREVCFLSSLTPPRRRAGVIDESLPLSSRVDEAPDRGALDAARSQCRRARDAGLPEAILARDYALPLFTALVRADHPREAGRLWEQDLRDGAALDSLPYTHRFEAQWHRALLAEIVGDLPSARRWADRTVETARAASEEEPASTECPRNLSVAHNTLGDVLRAQGDLSGALAAYRAGLAIAEPLAARDPSRALWQRDLSVSHDRIGDVLGAQGDLSGALTAYRASLAIRERLAVQDPSHTQWQRDLSVSHERIGDVLGAQGDLSGALTAHRASRAICERLAGQDPSHTGWQRDLSVSHERIGDVLRLQGDGSGALTAYRASHAIAERLAAQDPSHTEWQRDLSVSHNKIGDVLGAQGDLSGALTAYRASLAIAERLAELDPTNADWVADLAISCRNVAALAGACETEDVKHVVGLMKRCQNRLRTLRTAGRLGPRERELLDALDRDVAKLDAAS